MGEGAKVVILGPQRLRPTLREAVETLGITGRLATITAGWQEREADDRELDEHLAGRTTNLEIYRRSEEVFAADAELRAAHHEKQERIRLLREAYSVRLAHALGACHALMRKQGELAILGPERLAALEAVRDLDAHHLKRVAQIQDAHEARVRTQERPAVARVRKEIEDVLAGVDAVAVAGGHVALLLNRLRLFDMGALLRGRTVLAWSAGSMAVSQRVILFHDTPPQGAGNAEVMENGLALAEGLVPLPHVHRRLKLDEPSRVAVFARRFAPAACLGLEDGAILRPDAGGGWHGHGALRLSESGDLDVVGAA